MYPRDAYHQLLFWATLVAATLDTSRAWAEFIGHWVGGAAGLMDLTYGVVLVLATLHLQRKDG